MLATTTRKATGRFFSHSLAGDERGEGDAANQQGSGMRVAEVADEVRRALPEVAMRSLESEELRQLRACQVERQPRLETDQHGFRKEPDRIASPDRPGDECDCGHHERHARGERGVARGITAAQFADRGADEQRQRRGDGDDRMAGAAEQPEDETRKETRVKSASGGRPASDASPIPAGSRYAASVSPATMSGRSHASW